MRDQGPALGLPWFIKGQGGPQSMTYEVFKHPISAPKRFKTNQCSLLKMGCPLPLTVHWVEVGESGAYFPAEQIRPGEDESRSPALHQSVGAGTGSVVRNIRGCSCWMDVQDHSLTDKRVPCGPVSVLPRVLEHMTKGR